MITAAGQPKIADFGIAKVSMSETTVPGQVLGTPAYMSPEQLNGKPVDGRSDLFSLGVIAYWLLTGVKPFDGATLTEICVQVVTKEPTPASQIAPGVNADFDYVLSRALAKDPTARYQRGNELAADFKDLCAGNKPGSMAQASRTRDCAQNRTDCGIARERCSDSTARGRQGRCSAAGSATEANGAQQNAHLSAGCGVSFAGWRRSFGRELQPFHAGNVADCGPVSVSQLARFTSGWMATCATMTNSAAQPTPHTKLPAFEPEAGTWR